MASKMVLFALVLFLGSLLNCGPGTQPEPKLSACGTYAAACIYDGLAQRPTSLVYFRPNSRWPYTNLTWSLVTPLDKLNLQDQLQTIERAFFLWQEASTLDFERVEGDADITISFESGDLGDGIRFDGAADAGTNEMGRAFFPGTPRAGLIQLDALDNWTLDALNDQPDLFTVILHEIGHTVGLEHSLDENAVMAAKYIGPVSDLTQDDIDAIQRLYGSRDLTVPPIAIPTPGQFTEEPPTNLTNPVDPAIDPDNDSDGDGLPDALETYVLGSDPQKRDSIGDGVQDYTAVFVNGSRVAPGYPVATAITDKYAIEGGRSARLNGTFSYDPDGLPLTYSWRQTGGPLTPLTAANTATPSFVTPLGDSDVTLTFELTVNNGTLSGTGTVSILVWGRTPDSAGPVAHSGLDQAVDPGEQVTLDGSGSADPNNLELAFSWSQEAGPTVTLSDSTDDKPTFRAPQVGTNTVLTFELRVSNGSALDTDTVNVTVQVTEPDSDGDGLSDNDETYFYGTDPDNPDTDGDGFDDGADQSPTNRNFS